MMVPARRMKCFWPISNCINCLLQNVLNECLFPSYILVCAGMAQGWHSGESARLPPMWPGFDSRTRRHMWVEFVVSSRPCSEGFSPGTPVFLPP